MIVHISADLVTWTVRGLTIQRTCVRTQFFPQNNNEELRQPETRAIMSWIRATRFTASASFHEVVCVHRLTFDNY